MLRHGLDEANTAAYDVLHFGSNRDTDRVIPRRAVQPQITQMGAEIAASCGRTSYEREGESRILGKAMSPIGLICVDLRHLRLLG